ncbi:MAG: gliding motility protein GldN [Bacteroidales bacterium]|nr:gliding motility protein GldN [Bacteroidales bacterium]MBP5502343.1 gliding motility protein GldN [Bacteroidales bacterium]MBR4214259.1 gliding motility protein GldN [Bacteroidales bacterium]
MKKVLFLTAVVACLQCLEVQKTEAQVLLGLPYEKIHTTNRKPVPYQFVREADVMWSKIIWRQIELSERANQHLYFPTTPVDGRQSLIDVLLDGIHSQGLTAYDESGGDEFAQILTEQMIHKNLGASVNTETFLDENENVVEKLVETPYVSSEVTRYRLKELWFFDKQRSVLECRIIGLCAIRVYHKDPDDPEERQTRVFWIYYPEARKLLANAECFNPKNDGARLSFEDIFQKRYFQSFIVAESNMYDNRLISEYAQGQECLLEAENIKEQIFNFEQDLWEY